MTRGGTGDDNVADLTLRLLREIRTNMATKTDLAEVSAEIAGVRAEIADVRKDMKAGFTKLETRIDVVARIVKDNYRVLARRIRAVEVRVSARRPR